MNIFMIIHISRHGIIAYSFLFIVLFLSFVIVYLVYSCHAFIAISWYLVYSLLGFIIFHNYLIFLYLFSVYLSVSCVVCGIIVSDIIVVLGRVVLFVLLGYLLISIYHHAVSHCNHMHNRFML